MAFFVPTRFVWRFGGRQVHLCGSFTRWVETIPMAPVDGTPGLFAVVVHLPPGYHQYKFIVDGRWMHDETAPYMPDPLGNVNNWLFVRRIEAPAGQNGLPVDQQQQLLQQLQEHQQHQAAAAALNQQQQAQAQAAAVAAAAQQQQQLHAEAAAAAQAQQQQQQQQQQQHVPMLHQAGFGVGPGGGGGHPAAAAAGGLSAALAHPGILAQGMMAPGLQQQHPQQQQQQAAAQQLALSAAAAAAAAGPSSSSAAAAAASAVDADVDMAAADSSVVAPIIIQNEREPDLTKKKVSDFLHSHSAYELIPESGKVVLLDVDLPVRQAFHALHEQGIASAPLYDSQCGGVVGVISASDFIHMLRRLRNAVSSGNNPLSEAEMDAHTIRAMREECALEGRPPKPLVYVRTADKLATVITTLFEARCSMAPILSCDPGDTPGAPLPSVLHIATLSGVLNCLMRHFRASLASLPLLALPLSQLPIGTWAPEQQFASPGPHQQQQQQHNPQQQLGAAGVNGPSAAVHSIKGRISGSGGSTSGGAAAADGGASSSAGGGEGGVVGRTVSPLHAVTPNTPLTTALGMLLEAGVSALPVVNEQGVLLDIYARADITQLCRSPREQGQGQGQGQVPTYSRLQQEDVTVGQALALCSPHPSAWQQAAAAGSRGAVLPPDFNAAVGPNPHLADSQLRGGTPGGSYGAAAAAAGSCAGGRVAVAYQDDPLRVVVERLAAPGVRRLVVVDAASRRVRGVVSLSDVAAYLFL